MYPDSLDQQSASASMDHSSCSSGRIVAVDPADDSAMETRVLQAKMARSDTLGKLGEAQG